MEQKQTDIDIDMNAQIQISPNADIILDERILVKLPIKKGRKQGCPLSLSLFNFDLQILTKAIR